MKRKQPPKPRNPFVQHLISRKGAGAHKQSRKSVRAQTKAELRKQLSASAKSV